MKIKFGILGIFTLLVVVACKIYIPHKNEIKESDWPNGLEKGSYTTTKPLYLLKREKVFTYGYDFHLKDSVEHERNINERIDLPEGTEVQVSDFISIEAYGVKDWYAIGSVKTGVDEKQTFLNRLHFGYDPPDTVDTPWK